MLPTLGSQVLTEVFNSLIQEGIPRDQVLHNTSDFLFSPEFEETPAVKISCMLWATIARAVSQGGQKKEPERGIFKDVSMISLYLPYCDTMFIDNKMREYLRQKPLCDTVKSVNTRIFSPNIRDDFIEYLDEIESNASPSHMQAVEEVFGPL